MSVATFLAHISFVPFGAIFHRMFLMEAKGTHPILIYYDPLVFGGKGGEVGTVFREMVTLSVHIRVDHTDGIMYLLIVLGVCGHRNIGRYFL